jgi:bifunctional non-homologous end joining protein LigD
MIYRDSHATNRSRSTDPAKKKADLIEPMECLASSSLPEGSDWSYEVKLDGYRAIVVRTSSETILYSRNHKNFNKRFPQIAEALGDLPADTVSPQSRTRGKLGLYA